MKTDYIGFYRELARCFPQIGMVVPSSKALARDMVAPLREMARPACILEVGPGTGPITREILKEMGPEDRLTICEINPRFLNRLKKQLQKNPDFQRNKERVNFFEGPVQKLGEQVSADFFDAIVSSLPFYNFTPEMVEEIFSVFEKILRPGGALSFLEYLVTRQIGYIFSSKDHRVRTKGVESVIRKWSKTVDAEGRVQKKISLLNVPPALSYYFYFPENDDAGKHQHHAGGFVLGEAAHH